MPDSIYQNLYYGDMIRATRQRERGVMEDTGSREQLEGVEMKLWEMGDRSH